MWERERARGIGKMRYEGKRERKNVMTDRKQKVAKKALFFPPFGHIARAAAFLSHTEPCFAFRRPAMEFARALAHLETFDRRHPGTKREEDASRTGLSLMIIQYISLTLYTTLRVLARRFFLYPRSSLRFLHFNRSTTRTRAFFIILNRFTTRLSRALPAG